MILLHFHISHSYSHITNSICIIGMIVLGLKIPFLICICWLLLLCLCKAKQNSKCQNSHKESRKTSWTFFVAKSLPHYANLMIHTGSTTPKLNFNCNFVCEEEEKNPCSQKQSNTVFIISSQKKWLTPPNWKISISTLCASMKMYWRGMKNQPPSKKWWSSSTRAS